MIPKTYPIIGMSPGNSYFKDDEVRYLLRTVVEKYGRTAVLIADIPAIATYIAFGYPENRARRDKAIPQGNAFRNRTDRIREELGYTKDQVKIVHWADEIESNALYQEKYKEVRTLYDTNENFRTNTDSTTKEVLLHSGRDIKDIDAAIKIAVHYLLSEFAFLEFAPPFFGVAQVSYVYHKNWPVYEEYISGKYDLRERPYLDFILLENPYETYNPLWAFEGDTESTSVFETKLLRAAFTIYDPALLFDSITKEFSGIFYEVLERVAREEGWKILWIEETGYGVIQEGLKEDRFDIFGSTAWPTPERLKEAIFSESLYESKVYPWVQEANDILTVDSLKRDTSTRVAIKEGDISDSIAVADFPMCRLVRVPQLSSVDSILEFVAKDLADVTFVEPYLASLFNHKNEHKIISLGNPLRTYENSFMMSHSSEKLKELLDRKIRDYKENGFIASLVKKYTGNENTFS